MATPSTRPQSPDATRSSAADITFGNLRQRILQGDLKPGTRLIDASVAEHHGVSRNTAREALRLLVADELATWERNLGYSVRSLSADDVRNLYQARRVIELGAIRQSVRSADELLNALERVVAQAESVLAARQWANVGTASLNFHQAIVALAGSATLDAFFARIAAQLRLAFAVMENEGDFQAHWVPLDRAIADLVRSGRREEAITALDRYLTDSESRVVDAIRAVERAS